MGLFLEMLPQQLHHRVSAAGRFHDDFERQEVVAACDDNHELGLVHIGQFLVRKLEPRSRLVVGRVEAEFHIIVHVFVDLVMIDGQVELVEDSAHQVGNELRTFSQVFGSRQIHVELTVKVRVAHRVQREEIHGRIGVNFVQFLPVALVNFDRPGVSLHPPCCVSIIADVEAGLKPVTRQVLRQPVYVVRYGVDDSIRQRPVSGDRRNQTVGVHLRNRCTTGQQTVQICFVDSYVVVRKLPNELVEGIAQYRPRGLGKSRLCRKVILIQSAFRGRRRE
jgi:hypothetical protein